MPYIDIHTHNAKAQKDVLKVVNIFPGDDVEITPDEGVLYSAGIHPWYIDEMDVEAGFKKIKEWLKTRKIAAIGEAGLDSLHGPELSLQKDIFLSQVELSEEFEIPLIVHCVKVYNEILSLRKRTNAKQSWILHGFNSSVQMMQQMTETGIYISLGPALLRNKKLHDVCRKVPVDLLFFETDVSGENIKSVYVEAANVRESTAKELKQTIYLNFKTVFK